MQIICGPDLEFFEIISRWPGATNENKIFNISEIHQRFEYNQMDGILLADKNYTIRNFVLTPVEHPMSVKDWQYNEAHSNAYVIPEAIDIWKKRFKCLQTVLNNREGKFNFFGQELSRRKNIKYLHIFQTQSN